MAKDRLKRRIAEALAGTAARDELKRLLAGDPEPTGADKSVVLHPVLDNVKDPILAVDFDGIVQAANAAASRLLAASAADLVGCDVERFIPSLKPAPATLEALADRVADTFVDAAPELIEAQKVSGAPFTVEMTVSRNDHGLEQGYLLCMRDVTERLQD